MRRKKFLKWEKSCAMFAPTRRAQKTGIPLHSEKIRGFSTFLTTTYAWTGNLQTFPTSQAHPISVSKQDFIQARVKTPERLWPGIQSDEKRSGKSRKTGLFGVALSPPQVGSFFTAISRANL